MRLAVCAALLVISQLAATDPGETQLAREVSSKGWIIYSAKTETGDWDLFIMRPDGSHRRKVTNTPKFHEIGGRFSPDASRILYRRIPLDVKVHHDTWGR